MPELPEVETVVREIRKNLVGRRILTARFSVPRQLELQTPASVARAIKQQVIGRVSRRGKYILIELERGTLLVHLRMSGRLYVRENGSSPHRHERAVWSLDNMTELVFRDSRTLGTIRYFKRGDVIAPLEGLGWEPLAERITGDQLRAAIHKRKTAIKPLLLDQRLYAGIGNIYASEALWEAGISPRKQAARLTRAECESLANAVPLVLGRALGKGGSTLQDFMKPDGNPGNYQKEFRVYDREGEPCYRCMNALRRIVQAQRSTYFCPGCQK